MYLSASREEIDHLLDGTGTVHVKRNIDEILSNRLADDVALVICRIFQQLLAQIVTEGI